MAWLRNDVAAAVLRPAGVREEGARGKRLYVADETTVMSPRAIIFNRIN